MLKTRYTHQELKNMTDEERRALADEVRSVLIKTVSKNGGHLASNLGVVELTIALHSVFDSPKDTILFDVGHQSYVHKLLTGRSGRFDSLRQKGGLSGFPSRFESEHDALTSGHSSSSVSAALGIARAIRLTGKDGAVVAVIGDGAMTGGMSYEALNDAGHEGTPMIVILNDNKMSIAKNVGALSRHLTKLRQSAPYLAMKMGTRSLLERIPVVGKPVLGFMIKIQTLIRALLVHDSFFESLGFSYLGPIDGHDIKYLIPALTRCKKVKRPVVLHVVTQKGHGYQPAENSPDIFHGVAPFFIANGEAVNASEISYGQVACQELIKLRAENPAVCVITAAMTAGTGMEEFSYAHPDCFFDVGIAEEHAVAMAGGMAVRGLKPYVAIYSTFLQRAYDQIMMDVCLQDAPVTFLIDRAGLSGADGVTHQGIYDLSYLRSIPNLIIAAPRDVRALTHLMRLSATCPHPMAIRYPRETIDMGDGMVNGTELEIGRWEVLADGDDVVIFAVGRMVSMALRVSIELHGKNIQCAVVDARFIKPMDEEMLLSFAKRMKILVTLEDNVVTGGFGSGVLSCLAGHNADVQTLLLGVPDEFVAHATISEQMEAVGLNTARVADRIQEALAHARG